MNDEIKTCPRCGCPESPKENWCLECAEKYEADNNLQRFFDETVHAAEQELKALQTLNKVLDKLIENQENMKNLARLKTEIQVTLNVINKVK